MKIVVKAAFVIVGILTVVLVVNMTIHTAANKKFGVKQMHERQAEQEWELRKLNGR